MLVTGLGKVVIGLVIRDDVDAAAWNIFLSPFSCADEIDEAFVTVVAIFSKKSIVEVVTSVGDVGGIFCVESNKFLKGEHLNAYLTLNIKQSLFILNTRQKFNSQKKKFIYKSQINTNLCKFIHHQNLS